MECGYDFVVAWTPATGAWALYQFIPDTSFQSDPRLPFRFVKKGRWSTIGEGHELTAIGNYVIDREVNTGNFLLWQVDISANDFLPGQAVKSGKIDDLAATDRIIPLGNFLLLYTPSTGAYRCRRFDPLSETLMQSANSPQSLSSRWHTVINSELTPVSGYVLCRDMTHGGINTWMFDGSFPDNNGKGPRDPLPGPPMAGAPAQIDVDRRLCPVGDYLLDWSPSDGSCNVWKVDPSNAMPFSPLLKNVRAPGISDGTFGNDIPILFGLSPRIPITLPSGIQQPAESGPGSLTWMRKNIKKVVYLMLENRSFDHFFGYLYGHGNMPENFVGPSYPFAGASTHANGSVSIHANQDAHGKPWYQEPYSDSLLNHPAGDVRHGYDDMMRQFFNGDDGYSRRNPPDMSGFVMDYGGYPADVMQCYTPSVLSSLSELGQNFGISDAWYCSMPGPTDVNRAFSLTGSSFGTVDNFEGDPLYSTWPDSPRRPSVWDVLWSHGISDWKLYFHALWGPYHYTNHLFLQGHIAEVDGAPFGAFHADFRDSFFSDAAAGKLPVFSFIEPAWLGNSSHVTANSCHPPSDLEPALQLVADVYEALRQSPDFESTLLVITFDENGGIYDHVAPPYLNNPYRNDVDARTEFKFDLLGARVPTILVSPWIKRGTVFRPTRQDQYYDSTSFIATLLRWMGIPPSNWWLGDRVRAVATFESVFEMNVARQDAPPALARRAPSALNRQSPLNDLHRLFIPRIVQALGKGVLSPQEIQRRSGAILECSTLGAAEAALQTLKLEVAALQKRAD
jgi:phospholipase C